jgi:hypothetical protein
MTAPDATQNCASSDLPLIPSDPCGQGPSSRRQGQLYAF